MYMCTRATPHSQLQIPLHSHSHHQTHAHAHAFRAPAGMYLTDACNTVDKQASNACNMQRASRLT